MKLIYKNKNRTVRRVVEGALIQLNETFDGNKGWMENNLISEEICKKANIRQCKNICANDDAAASLVSHLQVSNALDIQQPLMNDNDHHTQEAEDHRDIPPRRSRRILERTRV